MTHKGWCVVKNQTNKNQELWRVERGGGLKFHDNKKVLLKVISARFLNLFGRHGDIYWTYHMQSINQSR